MALLRHHLHWRVQGGATDVSSLTNPLEDPSGGARDADPPGVQILLFSCRFWQKNCKIIALLGVGAAPSGKSWICHCNLFQFEVVFWQKSCQIIGFCPKFSGWYRPLGNPGSATDLVRKNMKKMFLNAEKHSQANKFFSSV